MKFSFKNDYSEGAHPRILDALCKTNLEQTVGYGCDPHCENAARLIRAFTGREDADVHFLVGGTQTNTTVIAAALRPYQAVISVQTGHICVHETGAIEASGHKIIAMPAADGKLTPALIREAVSAHTDEHMVQPKMVYISQSTEVGTLYSLAELEAIRAVCDECRLWLFVDGARLPSALASGAADMTAKDLARLADVFYLGGTKAGAFFGEALVITADALKTDFRYMIKQHGGMLAKGRLLGIQFECLFEDGLYTELGAHSNRMAMLLRDAFASLGFPFMTDSPTNQQFPILPEALIKRLEEDYWFEIQREYTDGTAAVRFVTSWSTPEEAVRGFIEDLHVFCGK